MDDRRFVRRRHARADRQRDVERAIDRERAALLQQIPERVPFDELHREEAVPIGFAEVVGARHVPVRDAPRQSDLAAKARVRLRAVGQIGPKRLERDDLTELAVLRPVHGPHSAHPEQTEDLVTTAEDAGRSPRGVLARTVWIRRKRRGRLRRQRGFIGARHGATSVSERVSRGGRGAGRAEAELAGYAVLPSVPNAKIPGKLVRRHHLELGVGAVARLLVLSPPPKLRRMSETDRPACARRRPRRRAQGAAAARTGLCHRSTGSLRRACAARRARSGLAQSTPRWPSSAFSR